MSKSSQANVLRARVSRRNFLIGGGTVAGLAVVGGPLLAACSVDNPATEGGTSGTSGGGTGEIVVAAPGLATVFAPDGGNSVGVVNTLVWPNLGAGLLRNPFKDVDGEREQDPYEFEGWLAESYEVSDDQRVVTFRMRPGVTSAMGNPLTADDVMWSMERRILAPTAVRAASIKTAIPDMSAFTKVDDMTVTLTVTDPKWMYAALNYLAVTYNGFIFDSVELKKHVTPDDPYAVAWSKTNYNFGFGPYKVTELTPNQQMVWTARPEAVFGEPKIKKITFRPVADAGTRANTLKSGDIDMALNLLPADMQSMLEDKNLSVPQYSNPNQTAMMTIVTTKAPFTDVRVRQALAYAIPYQQIIDNVYHGMAKKSNGFVNKTAPGYIDTGLPDYTYDVDKAKALLKDAGQTTVSFPLAVSNAVPDMQAVAVQIQSFAKNAGFNVEIQTVPDAEYQANWGKYAYTAFLWRDAVWNQDPAQQLTNFVSDSKSNNYPDYRDPQYWQLVSSSYDYPPFSKEAGEIWNKAEKELMEVTPMIWMVRVQPLNAARAGLKNIPFRYDGAIEFSEMSL